MQKRIKGKMVYCSNCGQYSSKIKPRGKSRFKLSLQQRIYIRKNHPLCTTCWLTALRIKTNIPEKLQPVVNIIKKARRQQCDAHTPGT